ncbi:UPF0488 protein CG14286 [Toxorhynchites rutilus septentrionalis]|uniref:UPF0488 protein CG14286 n=1 Tax=Toxorhynchites rutilus septentrionalis TaxID=329112 RepID=UPI002479F087|nr:UPF0488 protein CG14286 [Toxorhynchites rutilus septentrionalis]
MPPPKAKLHKNTGKLKSIPKIPRNSPAPAAVPASNTTVSSQSSASEYDGQFELELYWCIQQLENSLNAPHIKDNKKKVEDTMKSINILKSATQPLIKKRQIMRTTFGDYRAKMAEEAQTMALNPDSVGFDAPKKKAKYHFVKKAALLTSDKDFRFNFENIQLDDQKSNTSEANPDVIEPKQTNQEYVFGAKKPSDSQFKFNFSIED